MQFIRHTTTDSEGFQKALALYQTSFPVREQRGLDEHIRALTNPQFYCESIWDGKEFLGLMFYWEFSGYSYIEHFAIQTDLRGDGIGSQCLKEFCNRRDRVILEIDPPVDDISIRRKGFYERLGFHYDGYFYMHPSYQKGCTPHQLLIMSWPKSITEEEYRAFSGDLWGNMGQLIQPKSQSCLITNPLRGRTKSPSARLQVVGRGFYVQTFTDESANVALDRSDPALRCH